VAGNSNFEDDDDFFNNVDMPEDVPLQRVAPKSGSFWQEFVRWKFEKVTITLEFGTQCPLHLNALDVPNLKFRLFVYIFSTAAACKKQQQILDIQNSKFDISKSMS
jgi:hypothetical protein